MSQVNQPTTSMVQNFTGEVDNYLAYQDLLVWKGMVHHHQNKNQPLGPTISQIT
jgi:hypothetical protein